MGKHNKNYPQNRIELLALQETHIDSNSTMDKDKWIKVHYEDVCNHTEKTLDTIFDFIGVDSSKKRLDFKTVDHHVVGNGMRLDDSEVIKLDDQTS